MSTPSTIYACDIGKFSLGNFAWARRDESSKIVASEKIDLLVAHLESDIKMRRNIAIGFESPQYISVPLSPNDLGHGRTNEGMYSMFNNIGLRVTMIGIQEIAWLFRRIIPLALPFYKYSSSSSDWPSKNEGKPILFTWEAFVSGRAHGTHLEDAVTAILAFVENENNLGKANAVLPDHPFSFVNSIVHWSGWSLPTSELQIASVVIRPDAQLSLNSKWEVLK